MVHLVIIVVVIIGSSATFLSNRNLDALVREHLAEVGAVADSRELLRRIDLEDIAENGSKNGRPAAFDWEITLLAWRRLNVAKGESESRQGHGSVKDTLCSLRQSAKNGKADIPEGPFSSHTEILHDEPDANLILGVVQSESASCAVTNKVSRKHALNT